MLYNQLYKSSQFQWTNLFDDCLVNQRKNTSSNVFSPDYILCKACVGSNGVSSVYEQLRPMCAYLKHKYKIKLMWNILLWVLSKI